MFSQGQHKIKNTWLLLDTCSSNSVSNNPRMVKNVDKCKNKDILMFQMIGRLKYFSTLQVYTYPPFEFTTNQTPYQPY